MLAVIAETYKRIILGNPKIVLLTLAVLSVFFIYHMQDFKLDASADSLLLESDESLRIFREVSERFGTQDFLFVTFTPIDDLFSDSSLQYISELRDEFARLAMVDSVTSLVDVQLLKLEDGKLSDVAKNYRTLSDLDVDREVAKNELLKSPIYNNLIISEDGTTTALQLNLKSNNTYVDLQKKKNQLMIKKSSDGLSEVEERELEQVLLDYEAVKIRFDFENHENIKNVREIISKYQDYGTLHLGGLTMVADDMISFIKNDLVIFGIGVAAFLIMMLSVIFRQMRWVVLPLLSCTFSGMVMLGLLGYFGWAVTVISSNFISLMLILTMSMNVHLIVRFRQLKRDNPEMSQFELVFNTTRRMVWPCLYTALTTMIGFASLVVSDIKPVIDFGWMMTLGLGVTFLTSFILFPTVLVSLDKVLETKTESDEIPFTAALARFTEKHGNKVMLVSVILAVVSIFGITQLKVENSFINYFSKRTEIYRGFQLIDEKLGGTTPLDIVIKFNPIEEYGEDFLAEDDEMSDLDALFGEIEIDPADAWFTSYKLDRINAVHNYLDNLSAVGKVLSLSSVIQLAEELNKGEELDAFELAIIYKRIPQELRESIIDPYISISENEARISTRIVDSMPDLRRNELLLKIADDLEKQLQINAEDIQITGLMILYNNMLQSLFKSQVLTLGVVMIGIAVMLLVLFQSFSLAVIGIIPNILAATTILGLMGLVGIPLDMMTITIAAISIGIAVDNSIHYIYRFREELPKRGGDYVATLHYCHASIGRAVFYTALIIIIGFSILVFSNFIPTIYFGLLTALAMFIALLAALTLLPRLILVLRPF